MWLQKNQLHSRYNNCITENITLGAWSRANKALGCTMFIGFQPRPHAIFPAKLSHGTLTSIYGISYNNYEFFIVKLL